MDMVGSAPRTPQGMGAEAEDMRGQGTWMTKGTGQDTFVHPICSGLCSGGTWAG